MVSSVLDNGLISALICCFLVQGISAAFHPLLHGEQQFSWPQPDRSSPESIEDSRLERSSFNGGSSCFGTSELNDISENTIIRTKDSRALGAKFLNETSLGSDSRDKCLNLCCSFHGCNVAVYEEKDGGNCYLFDCGPPEDFRCKFTSHSHYTSGVIRHRENAHEEELTQLKKISIVSTVITPALPAPATNEPIITAPPTTSSTAKPVRSCSRYQFECHTTGECIAIYNACDGIIQCLDGSDEAPELGCPATTTEYSGTNGKLFATKSPPAIPFDPIPQRSSSIDVNVIPAGGQQQRPLWAGTNHADRDRFSEDNSWKTAQDGLRNYGGDRQRPPPYGEIKESYASEADRSVNPYYSPDINRHYVPAWREQERNVNNDYRAGDRVYNDRYYDKDVPRVASSYDATNIHPSRNNKHDWERNHPVVDVPSAPLPVEIRNPVVYNRPIDQQQQQPPPQQQHQQEPPRIQPPVQQIPIAQPQEVSVGDPTLPSTPQAKVTEPTTTLAPVVAVKLTEATTTAAPVKKASSLITKTEVVANHAHINHFHVNQADFQEEKAERSRQTVGAVWALILGLTVTAVLVLLVGCRLRGLKRHLRRGRVTRDADYLVNGMYL